jgi:oligopeptide transport system substrate-binding protein
MRGLPRGSQVVAGVAILTLALAACGSDKKEETPAGGNAGNAGAPFGKVSYEISEPQNPLIPSNTNETSGGSVVDALTTGLVDYDPKDAHPVNAMAESIETTDNKVYTIKVKKGWKFHDGTEVTAKHYVDAWNWASNGENAQLNSYFFASIAGYDDVQGEDKDGDGKLEVKPKAKEMSGLKLLDDYSFEVTLSAPSSTFAVQIGYTAFVPLPDSFYKDTKAFGEKPVGNGPFKFVSWEHKQAVNVTAYEEYQGADKAKVKDLVFKVYQSQDAAYADLLSDNLDIHTNLPTSALAGDKYKADLGNRALEKAVGQGSTITVPNYIKDLNNPDLVKALSMAIDRDLIIKNIFNNTRIPAQGWVNPVVDGYQPGACGEFCTYNPEKAKELLTKSGFKGSISIGYNADGDHKTWIEAACNSIKNAIGVNCSAKPYVDFATLRKNEVERKMTGAYRSGWQMDYPSIENWLVPLYATGASSNDGDYSDPEFDRLVKLAATQKGPESIATYQQAEKQLAVNMAIIPLWWTKLIAGYSNNVDHIEITPFGTPDFASLTVKK